MDLNDNKFVEFIMKWKDVKAGDTVTPSLLEPMQAVYGDLFQTAREIPVHITEIAFNKDGKPTIQGAMAGEMVMIEDGEEVEMEVLPSDTEKPLEL